MNRKALLKSHQMKKKKSHLISLADLTKIILSGIEAYWTFMVIDLLGHQVDRDLTRGSSFRKLEKVPL